MLALVHTAETYIKLFPGAFTGSEVRGGIICSCVVSSQKVSSRFPSDFSWLLLPLLLSVPQARWPNTIWSLHSRSFMPPRWAGVGNPKLVTVSFVVSMLSSIKLLHWPPVALLVLAQIPIQWNTLKISNWSEDTGILNLLDLCILLQLPAVS